MNPHESTEKFAHPETTPRTSEQVMDQNRKNRRKLLQHATCISTAIFISTSAITASSNARAADLITELTVLFRRMRQKKAISGAPSEPEVAKTYTSYSDYLDDESRTIMRPRSKDWDQSPFGDGCWRSAWFYASLLTLRRHNRAEYQALVRDHGLTVEDAFKFIVHFNDNCGKDDGCELWRDDEHFTRDQLCPLLLLLACIKEFDGNDEARNAGKSVVKQLSDFEKNGTALSSVDSSRISRGIGYIIEQLCNAYGVVYRFRSFNAFQLAAAPEAARNAAANVDIEARNILKPKNKREKLRETDTAKIARRYHRDYTRFMFESSLRAYNELARFEGTGKREKEFGGKKFPTGLDAAIDGTAVFNTLALLSTFRVLRGKIDNDCKQFRRLLKKPAKLHWGPAFDIVVNGKTNDDIDAYRDMQIGRDLDNDILLAQRPSKFVKGTFPPKGNLKAGAETRLVLDFVVLESLRSIWGA